MESSFYQNVFLLTQVVPPSKEFLKHFKQGMFDKPNTVGFLHMSHYLLTIYDAERFKKQTQWPVFCKKTEAKYRTDVKDLLTAVANENRDVDFPQILASHLLHAGGSKFSTIMWKLSTVALRTYIKREESAINLMSPKPGVAGDLSKTLLNNIINCSTKIIEDLNESMVQMENEAELCAKEMAEPLQKNQEELLLARQSLRELAENATVHPEMKKRLADPNDTEVIEMWKASFADSMKYLKMKQRELKEITEYSNNVAAIVASVASTDSNLLDGSCLSKIDVNAVSAINGLSPEAQIILHRLYADENLVLEKFLLFFSLVLSNFLRNLDKHGFPDMSECDAQVSASCEDMKSMSVLFRGLHDRIANLSSEIKNGSICGYRKNSQNYFSSNPMDDDIFDSVILKSSPSININGNLEFDGTDAHGNIELTPVEDARNKALFARYKRHKDLTPQNHTKLRPKLLVSRINFEEANSSTISGRLSPVSRGSNSKFLNLSSTNKSGKFSRLFATDRRNPTRGLNSTVKSMQGSSRLNSIADISSTSHVYNISELLPHVVTTNKFNNRIMLTPPKRNSNRASSTIIEDEKYNSTIEISRSVINEGTELTLAPGCSPKIRKSEKQTDSNRRVSISDLVERYSKLRGEQSSTTQFENSSEASDESGKQ